MWWWLHYCAYLPKIIKMMTKTGEFFLCRLYFCYISTNCERTVLEFCYKVCTVMNWNLGSYSIGVDRQLMIDRYKQCIVLSINISLFLAIFIFYMDFLFHLFIRNWISALKKDFFFSSKDLDCSCHHRYIRKWFWIHFMTNLMKLLVSSQGFSVDSLEYFFHVYNHIIWRF